MATRRERVLLELQDDFSGPMARAAASTMLFKRALNDLDGTALKVDRALNQTTTSGSGVSREFDNGAAAIDRYSGRLGLAAQALAALGPAALPIAAVAIPAVTGLADALGVTILAGGTAVLALQGVGDALSKLNAAQLDPTAAHLKAAQLAFETLTPKAREFVLQMDAAAPALDKLKQSAGSGLFPGLSAALSGALTQLPKARNLLEGVSDALGNLGQMTGDSLASGAWGDFFEFLTRTAPPAIESLGHTVGNLAHGLASLWMAFDPLNTSVIGMLESGSQAFEDWAAALSQTDGFRDFVSYLQTSGPEVASALGSIGNAVLQVVEAIAPLGGPSLRIIEALADAIGTIADSPIGTPLLALVAAMSALSLATRGYEAVRAKAFGSPAVASLKATTSSLLTVTSAQERATLSAGALARAESERAATARGGLATLGKQAGAIAGLALVSSGAADSFGLSNTAMLGLTGSLAGPFGAAAGAGVGALLDLKAAGAGATESLRGLDSAAASGNLELLADKIKNSRQELEDYKNTDFSGFLGLGDIAQRVGSDISNVASGRYSDQSDEYQASIDKNAAKLEVLSQKARIAGQAQSELENYTSGVNRALYDQEAALAATVKAMQEQRDEAARAVNAQLNYQSAILDAKDALKENGATADKTTREGIANRQVLYGLATAWNSQSDAAKNAKGSLRDARANFLETADAMKVPQAEAQRLAKRLFEIPTSRVTTVSIQDAATQKLIGIRNELASLKDKSVYVGVRGPGVGGMGPQLRAAGGYISGPGTATSDSIPARLSNGEYVVQAKAVERYGVAMFDHLNAQRFATGGAVKKGGSRDVVNVTGFSDGARDTSIPDSLRGLRHELADTQRAFNKASSAADRASEAADREVSARDGVIASMASLASDIANQFDSNLFEPLNDAWGSNRTTSDPISVLMADIANSNQSSSLFAGLQARGLSGDALTAAARGGVAGLQTVGAYSDADLARYADLYAQREASRTNTGQQVAQAQFGQALTEANNLATAALAAQDQTNAELREIKAQLGAQTKVVKQVEDATKDNGRATASGRRNRVRRG